MKNRILFSLFLLLVLQSCFAQKITFIAMGDWGRNGEFGQKETADEMGKYAEMNKVDFILTLGDNFYPTGVKNTVDNHWKTSFEDVYTASSLQVPWYITLGNHDYGGSVQAQIDYSALSNRWKLPSRYYSFESKIDDSAKALIVIIDSNPFIKSYYEINPEDSELNKGSIEDLKKQDVKIQLNWLDSVLSASDAKWKIVAGHHTVYSGGSHGNTPELIDDLKPLLEKYNVNLYLAGHDHDMQHLRETGSNVNYFVSGAGSQLRTAGKISSTLFSQSSNGFLAVSITNAGISASFISTEGKVLYEATIK